MGSGKRILILMAEAGFGHRSAAKAIAMALQEAHGEDCVVEIVNPLDDERTPAVLRNSQREYDRNVREIPDLYKIGYDISDKALSATVMESAFTLMLLETLRDLIKSRQPDVIVTTYQSYLAPLSAVFTLTKRHIPLITVVTDFTTVHRLWFNNVSDLCLVPTQAAYDLALKEGLSPEKVRIVGIPVHPEFSKETPERSAVREQLGWQADLTTLLVVGGKRVQHLPDVLRVLNHSGLPLQLAIVAGGDDELYQQLQDTEWHVATHIYSYVDRMPTLMRAADCIVCKAGGLVLSEALACGLPILLIDAIQGQETGNAEYVLQNHAGAFAHNPIEALEILYHWLYHNGEQLAQHAQHARSLGRPCAAHDIAELVWSASL
jgi:1,2-diacylglycerol 3-beta-galactosyltransferase